ncbi:hypothetical protein DP117_13245 [Brasilonema sp. UFV-L1]|nr:hypothetical protein [Brasilonema sp. UFV-L1]
MTSSCEEIAEVCNVAKLRYFLLYAHGFRGIGRDPMERKSMTDVKVATRVAECLKTRSPSTHAVNWNPGDMVLFKDGKIVVQQFPVRR